MGWLWLALVGTATMAALVALGVRRSLWSFVGAALMLGAAGYAWQGSPMQGGSRANPTAAAPADDPAMVSLRDDMFGRFTLDGAYVIASDAMIARGDDRSAVRILLGGLGKLPTSYALWTALGTAYARHDGGQLSPASRFAFEQAHRLAPGQPAPLFFQGLVHVRSGDFTAARPLWLAALRLTSGGSSVRREIALRLALLDRAVAIQQSAPTAR